MKPILCFLAMAWLAPAASAADPPAIASFSAASPQIASGQTAVLKWSVTGATSLKIDQGVGTVTGTSVKVTPKTTTKYTLTATSTAGSRSASVTVTVGSPPAISSFTANPVVLPSGQSATLTWVVTGATSLKLDPGGAVTGTSLKISPKTTTTYTLTATNPFGTKTSTVTVTVGAAPAISSFTASPAKIKAGQSSTLSWTVTGSPGLILNPGVGVVTGTSVKLTPLTTTTYTLSATNSFGTAKATVTVGVGDPPVISYFSTNANMPAGPGVSAKLQWSTTGATTLSIDHGVGTVTGTSVNVSPTAPTTYTLTASNAVGSATASLKINYMPLKTVTSQVYYSEHAFFLIPDPNQVNWKAADNWSSVFSKTNIDSYVARLKSVFPVDFFFVVVTANNLTPNSVPNVLTYGHLADGIGQNSIKGVGVPNICRYNIGGGTVTDGAFGVLDHEIGHNWEVFIGSEVGTGHWLSNSTASGQMATIYSDDDYATDKLISGDPTNGFTWSAIDNLKRNETDTFSLQDLYLMGLNETFPDLYVLASPVYNSDHTMSYLSVAKYDQTWVEGKNGMRYPTYRTSDKRLRMAVVYVARDLAEVLQVYQPIERSINQFANAEEIDTKNYRFQVPFLVDTQYRASVDPLLADLDGNHTPTLSITGSTALSSTYGSAMVPFKAADADGTTPVVSCVPASTNCAISGKTVVLSGLASGAHFFTIKAEDSGGKKTFAHFVVDVQ